MLVDIFFNQFKFVILSVHIIDIVVKLLLVLASLRSKELVCSGVKISNIEENAISKFMNEDAAISIAVRLNIFI